MREGWETKALGEVCDVIGGGTPSKDNANFYTGDIPWATVRDMRSDVITQTEFKITKAAVASSATNVISCGNVVIATRVGLGKVCLLEQDTAINQDLRGIIPKDCNILHVRYLFWWLKSISDLIIAEGTGATVQGVKLPFIKSLKISLPPLPEQQRIVAILDEAFSSIATARANTERNLQNARALFESYLHEVFSKRGEGWELCKMGDVYDVRDGTHDSPKFYDAGYPLVTSKNLKRYGLDLEAVKFISEEDYNKINQRSAVNVGDILFAMIGTIGNPVLVKSEPNYAIKNMALFKVPSNQSSEFLRYFLAAEITLSRMKSEANGTTQKFVGLGYLRKFEIALPNISTQRRTVEALNAISFETQRLESIYQRKLNALDELKQSLLHQAFSGRL